MARARRDSLIPRCCAQSRHRAALGLAVHIAGLMATSGCASSHAPARTQPERSTAVATPAASETTPAAATIPKAPPSPGEDCLRQVNAAAVTAGTEDFWSGFVGRPGNSALALLVAAQLQTDPSERSAQFDCAGRALAFQKGTFPRLATLSYGGSDRLRYLSERWLLADAAQLYDVESRRLVFEVPSGEFDSDEKEDQEATSGGRWDGTEDGPVHERPDGSRTLFRHLSDVSSDGGFTVGRSLSPDGTRVLTAGMGDTLRGEEPLAARLWEVETGRRLWNRQAGPGHDTLFARWSPDGKLIAIVTWRAEPEMRPDRGWLNVLDAKTGRLVSRVESDERHRLVPGGSPAPYSDAVWFSDSERLIVSRASSASVIEARTGREQARLNFGFEPDFVGLSLGPSERWLLARGDHATAAVRTDGSASVALPANSQHVFSPLGNSVVVHDEGQALLVHLNGKAEVATIGPSSVGSFDERAALASSRLESPGATPLSLPFSLPPGSAPPSVRFRFEAEQSRGTRMTLIEPGSEERSVLLESVGRTLEHCMLESAEVSCFETSTTHRFSLSHYDLKTGKRASEVRFGQDREARWLASDSLSKLAQLSPVPGGVRIRLHERADETPLRELTVPWFPIRSRTARLDDDLRNLVVIHGGWLHHIDLAAPERSGAYAWIGEPPTLIQASLDLTRPVLDDDPIPTELPDCVIGDTRVTSAACIGMWFDRSAPTE